MTYARQNSTWEKDGQAWNGLSHTSIILYPGNVALPWLVEFGCLNDPKSYIYAGWDLRSFPLNKIEHKVFVKLSQVVIYHGLFRNIKQKE